MRETRLEVLVVDDEPLARQGICALLRAQPVVPEIREAANASEAIRMINERPPQIVFLDVQMPRVDGFGVIESIGAERMPLVIFVTAHSEHAHRAFDVHAIDYLLKPIDPERFRDALDRACRALEANELASIRASLATLIPLVRAAQGRETTRGTAALAGDSRLRVRHEGKIVLVNPQEIDWLESVGNYVRLHIRGATLTHRATMDGVQAMLDSEFVRIRRSAMVRAAAVRYCEPMGKGSYVVVLHDGTRLTSSRYYRDQLAALLGS